MDCLCLFFLASMVVCTGSLDQIQEENLRKKSHTELAVHAAHSTVVQFCYRRGLKLFILTNSESMAWVCLFFPASMVVCTGSLHQIQEENLRKKSHTEHAAHCIGLILIRKGLYCSYKCCTC